MTHDPLCLNVKHSDGCLCCEISAPCIYCDLIAKVREDEGRRYVGMAVVHWDAGHAWGLHDAEMKSRKQSLRKGLWIGWAIGTFLMLIPLIVLAVTQ
jgi:hypothetical protein